MLSSVTCHIVMTVDVTPRVYGLRIYAPIICKWDYVASGCRSCRPDVDVKNKHFFDVWYHHVLASSIYRLATSLVLQMITCSMSGALRSGSKVSGKLLSTSSACGAHTYGCRANRTLTAATRPALASCLAARLREQSLNSWYALAP